jgi:ankyrin repeat protein
LNHNGKSGLHLAAYYNQSDVVRALLHTNTDINLRDKEERTALYQAVIRENIEVVRIPVHEREDIDVNIQDKKGYSALHHVIRLGNIEITRILLDSRKDLDIHTTTKKSVLTGYLG